uniref:Uncharacterized protein n=1 Tax=Panagrolaimus sp. JU765 TaxID=591449 RepID=A0AC34QLE1_9BILA
MDDSLHDVTRYRCPDALFGLSSMLYRNADRMTISDRRRIYPIVAQVVEAYKNTPAVANVLRSVNRFIEDELLPYVDSIDSDDDELVDYEESFSRFPHRKGSPLRFDTLSVVLEVDSLDANVISEISSPEAKSSDIQGTETCSSNDVCHPDDPVNLSFLSDASTVLALKSAPSLRMDNSDVTPDIDFHEPLTEPGYKHKKGSFRRTIGKLARRFTLTIRNKFKSP